jgi:predicted Zn-dependent protease
LEGRRRDGPSGLPSVGTSNWILEGGEGTREELLRGVKAGLYAREVMGPRRARADTLTPLHRSTKL